MNPAKKLGAERLGDAMEHWELVEAQLRDTTSLEVHVRAVVAGLIVIAATIDERGKWGAS